jgi:hypothetical protein
MNHGHKVIRRREDKKMATTNVTPTVEGPIEIVVKKTVFNLDTLQKKPLEGKVSFQPVKNIAEALQRMNGNQDDLVKIVNTALQRKAKIEGRKTLTSDDPNTIENVKVLMDFLRPLRALPPYDKMEKPQQNAALFAWLKQDANKGILEGLKAAALAAQNDSDEDSDEDED